MNAAAAVARPKPVQKLPATQSSPRKVTKGSASRIPEKRTKSPARRPKRRPDSASAAPSRSSGHTSGQAQAQVQGSNQQQRVEDIYPVNAAQAQAQAPTTATALPNIPKPNTIGVLDRSHSEGIHTGIEWIIHIDCPGGHAAPLKIVRGVETLEEDDVDKEYDDSDDDDIQERVVMEMSVQSSLRGASASASDLTSNSKSLRVPAQPKRKNTFGDIEKLTQSMSGLDSRGLQTGSHYLAQEVASDDISRDDTIEGSEVLLMEEEEDYEKRDSRPRDRLEGAQGHVYDSSDDDDDSASMDSSEASEDDRDRYLHLPDNVDEDDQSIDPMGNFSPRTAQDSQDDDLIEDLPSGILTESSTVLESCSTMGSDSGPDVEEFDNGGNSVTRTGSSQINFDQSLSALPEEAVLSRAEMTNYDDQADQETEPGGVQTTSSSVSQIRKQADRSSARYKIKQSRRHVPAADKSSRRSKTFNASMPELLAELQPEKDSSDRPKRGKARRQKSTAEKSLKPFKDSNASMPELQPGKDSLDPSKSGKARRQKSTLEKSCEPIEDSNVSMPELQPEKDSLDPSKSGKARRQKSTPERSSKLIEDSNVSMPQLQPVKDSLDLSKSGKARRQKSTPERSSKPIEDSNVSMPELQHEKHSSNQSKRDKARRNNSTPEKFSKTVEDFNASMPDLHGAVPNVTEDFESDSYFGLQGVLTSAVLKREAENAISDQDPTGALPSISTESSSSPYNNEQKGRDPIQRTTSAPFARLDLSAKEGIQICENKESGEKSSRRREPSRSKSSDESSDDGALNFAQLDLTGDSSGVQFHDNETVNRSDSPTVVGKRSKRRAHNRSHSADESGVNNETVNLPESPVADKKSVRRDRTGRSKSADSTLNFIPPKSAGQEEPTIPPSLEAAPAPVEAPPPRSIRGLVKMGSNLISSRKTSKSNSNLKALDPENKKRFMSFGNSSVPDHGDLLDDDDSLD
jgi:hypothetical protein